MSFNYFKGILHNLINLTGNLQQNRNDYNQTWNTPVTAAVAEWLRVPVESVEATIRWVRVAHYLHIFQSNVYTFKIYISTKKEIWFPQLFKKTTLCGYVAIIFINKNVKFNYKLKNKIFKTYIFEPTNHITTKYNLHMNEAQSRL